MDCKDHKSTIIEWNMNKCPRYIGEILQFMYARNIYHY